MQDGYWPDEVPLPKYKPSVNPEQHRYVDDQTTAHNCKHCGYRKSSAAHQRYERAAQPFRSYNQGIQAGNVFNQRLRTFAEESRKPEKPKVEFNPQPSTMTSGKKHRFDKWKRNLAGTKPGSDKETMCLAMLETFSRGFPTEESWVKAEKLRRSEVNRLAEQELRENIAKVGPGKLYFAPLGTDPNSFDGWVNIGYTEEGISVAESLEPIKYAHTDHVHFDLTSVDMTNLKKAFNGADLGLDRKSEEIRTATQEVEAMMNVNQNPADMEKAALRLATLAQEIREHDEREPQGDEPVITWKRTFTEGGTEYTYVAVKLGDRWYVTGNQHAGTSYVWRDFLDKDFAKPVAAGEFLICAEWTPAS